MRIDFSALDQFYKLLPCGCIPDAIQEHPAYRAIHQHAHHFGSGIALEDLARAFHGAPSRFYGLNNLQQNLPRIHALETEIRRHAVAWCALAAQEIHALLPDADLDDICIYPVIGYDMGIGMGNTVCMNLNTEAYLQHPVEFLYYLIHETIHILYERSHPIPALWEVETAEARLAYFALWTQNEGFAVYAPLRLRARNGDLRERDYAVLTDPRALETCLRAFQSTLQALQSLALPPFDTFLEQAFGPQRLTYRAGCETFRRIEQREGSEAVRRAFAMPAEDFLRQYVPLLVSTTR